MPRVAGAPVGASPLFGRSDQRRVPEQRLCDPVSLILEPGNGLFETLFELRHWFPTEQVDRTADIGTVVAAGIPCHVLWAERDTLLRRSDGQDFARDLHATFDVVNRPPGYGRVDHDWMFDDPELFASHLDALGLRVLARSSAA